MHQALRPKPESPTRILLIDIDDVSGIIFESLVKSTRKYRLIVTSTFSDGISSLKENECDVVLLACNKLLDSLPRFIKQLLLLNPNLSIVVLGEDISEDQGAELLRARASDYVSVADFKPEILDRSLRYAVKSNDQAKEIKQLRDSDSLTDLGNRQLFQRVLHERLESITQTGNKLALVTIDINNFRALNSRYGQHNGDNVVIELGHRIKKALPRSTTAARLGNDEFALLLETSHFEDIKQSTTQFLQHLCAIIQVPFRYGHTEMQINCSIGVSLAPQHALDSEQLLHRSVLARQESKKAFNTSFSFFDESMEQRDDLHSDLVPEITAALRSNQFVLFYQPQVNLRTGKIEGAETLIRWQHPERGLLYPDSFIPVCEQLGLIVPIGYWVVHQACVQLNKLHQDGINLKHLGINLSFRQFGDDRLVPTIQRIISKTNVDTSVLELELTESALHNDEEHVISCLQSLSESGLSFSLDDFGTGYSSFSLLQKLPIDTIKIDRSFITNVASSDDDAEIVRAIINLAHNMGKSVIAEGVENQEQLDFLISHGCDIAQGYFFSRPVDFDTFRHTLQECAIAV